MKHRPTIKPAKGRNLRGVYTEGMLKGATLWRYECKICKDFCYQWIETHLQPPRGWSKAKGTGFVCPNCQHERQSYVGAVEPLYIKANE